MVSNSKEYAKTYYENNKDKILKKMCSDCWCSACGKNIKFHNMPRHKRSRKHIIQQAEHLKSLINKDLSEKEKIELVINKIKDESLRNPEKITKLTTEGVSQEYIAIYCN